MFLLLSLATWGRELHCCLVSLVLAFTYVSTSNLPNMGWVDSNYYLPAAACCCWCLLIPTYLPYLPTWLIDWLIIACFLLYLSPTTELTKKETKQSNWSLYLYWYNNHNNFQSFINLFGTWFNQVANLFFYELFFSFFHWVNISVHLALIPLLICLVYCH